MWEGTGSVWTLPSATMASWAETEHWNFRNNAAVLPPIRATQKGNLARPHSRSPQQPGGHTMRCYITKETGVSFHLRKEKKKRSWANRNGVMECSGRGRNSSVGRVLDSLSCLMQCRGFNPPLRRIFLVEGIFPLELTWVLTPFPQNSFGWEYKLRSSLCTHAFHRTDSKDPDIHVLDGWMPATKTRSMRHPWRRNVITPMVGLKTVTRKKNLTQNGEPQRYSLGTMKKKKKKKKKCSVQEALFSWHPAYVKMNKPASSRMPRGPKNKKKLKKKSLRFSLTSDLMPYDVMLRCSCCPVVKCVLSSPKHRSVRVWVGFKNPVRLRARLTLTMAWSYCSCHVDPTLWVREVGAEEGGGEREDLCNCDSPEYKQPGVADGGQLRCVPLPVTLCQVTDWVTESRADFIMKHEAIWTNKQFRHFISPISTAVVR